MLISKSVDVRNREYIGKVEDNEDPAQMQRIRVRLPQHPKNMKTEELPWAIPAKDGMFGSGQPAGSCIVPRKDTFVRVILCPDQYSPVYSQLQTVTSGNLTDDYPDTYGLQDPKGNFFKMNMIKELINILLKSEIRIEQTGDIKIKLAGNAHICCEGLYLQAKDINITTPSIVTNSAISCASVNTAMVITQNLSATAANVVGTFEGTLKGQASYASMANGSAADMATPETQVPDVQVPQTPDLDFSEG